MGRLILTRHELEEVVIGTAPNQVVVGVVKVLGDKVQLSFEAPKEIPIYRREVAERIEGEEA